MIFTETVLKGAYIIDLEQKPDHRGFFARTFCVKEFEDHGLTIPQRILLPLPTAELQDWIA